MCGDKPDLLFFDTFSHDTSEVIMSIVTFIVHHYIFIKNINILFFCPIRSLI